MPDYHYTQAQNKSGNIGVQMKLYSTNLYQILEKIDGKCKAIETYLRLRDYEKDNFDGGLQIINELLPLIGDFRKQKEQFEKKLSETHQKMRGNTSLPDYLRIEKNMRFILEKDKKLIDLMSYNFNYETPTAWIKEEIQKNINELDIFLESIKNNTPKIDYPASHYYSSFISCAYDIQKHKKYILDSYSLEARKSDAHANEAYHGLINYFDGCHVPFFNQFADFTQSGKLFPLKATKIAPVFELKTQAVNVEIKAKNFTDIPYQNFEIKPQNSAISTATNQALNKYIELINEEVGKANHLIRILQNQSVNLTDFSNTKTFYFYNGEFELPQSLFQETIIANGNLPESAKKSIKLQAQVLFDILKEMDELREECLTFAENNTHKKDGFKRIEEIRDRYMILFETLDSYKERFYEDLKRIFDSYKFANENNSWVKSYVALAEVLRDDRDLLFSAKKYYKKQDASPVFNKAKLEASTRKSIADEFANMKGIDKYGRSHGLCPYSPYEDIGTTSQQFAAYPDNIAKKEYEDFIYLYNTIAYEQNRFVDLAKVPLLKQVLQPNLFLLKEPYRPKPREEIAQNTTNQNTNNTYKKPDVVENTRTENKIPKEVIIPKPVESGRVDTVQVIKKETVIIKETVIRDTIYVRDTIYLEKPPIVKEDFYNLKGYAPNNLILLLDVSSSMNTPDKLPLLQTSLKKLVTLLREEDDIALIVYSGTAQVVLPPTSGKDKDKIIKAIESLEPRGNTDANAGLALAYKVANQKYKYSGNNRIVLATDGEFSLRPVIFDMIGQNAIAGIALTIFKFGEKPTPNLKKISDKGKGNLVSINEKNAEIFMIQEAKGGKK